MKKRTSADRQDQALRALNCAVACIVAWPPNPEHLGGAVYFTALALHRLAQADPNGEAAAWAAKFLDQARDRGVVTIAHEEEA